MKGYLDAKELESYKKEDLQELAKQLGVDAEGTKKEIAARCAAVEVDIPDDNELTEEDKKAVAEASAKAEEEKAAAEAAAKAEEEKAAAEAAAKAEEEKAAAEAAAKAEEEKAAAEAAAKAEEEKKAARLVKVKVKRRFRDMELNQIKDTGDVYTVSRERAAVLEEAGVAAVMAE
jgi:membrane protein involved in colicin uptake